MKIKELSIGDWVLWMGKKCKVDLPLLNTEYTSPQGGEYIRPIPITPEILEKNGFVRKDGYRFVNIDILSTVENFGDKYYDFHNIYYKKAKTYRSIRVVADNIKYVHELQHAMKLAGIEKEIEV